MNVAFIGLGVMGYPMAGHLVKANINVTAFNRSEEKALRWHQDFPDAAICSTIKKTVNDADVIISCIGNDDDLRHCAYGAEGILANAKPGAVWVDHTTTSSIVAQELFAQCNECKMHFVDAPVSGGQSGAENGQLTIMLGGDSAQIAKITPVIEHYAKQITHVGPSGSGQLTKMVNQICLSGLLQGLSEGLSFAKMAGLDTDKVVQAIGKGAAQSWQMDNRAKTMCEGSFDFGFAVDLMRKDLNICLQQARNIKASLPVTALVDQFYAEVQSNGGAKWDTSSLMTRFMNKDET